MFERETVLKLFKKTSPFYRYYVIVIRAIYLLLFAASLLYPSNSSKVIWNIRYSWFKSTCEYNQYTVYVGKNFRKLTRRGDVSTYVKSARRSKRERKKKGGMGGTRDINEEATREEVAQKKSGTGKGRGRERKKRRGSTARRRRRLIRFPWCVRVGVRFSGASASLTSL